MIFFLLAILTLLGPSFAEIYCDNLDYYQDEMGDLSLSEQIELLRQANEIFFRQSCFAGGTEILKKGI